MNIKALITSLAIVGSSSVAMARPATYSAQVNASASFNLGFGPTVRDHRTPSTPTRAPIVVRPTALHSDWGGRNDGRYEYQPRPMMLADDLTFGNTEFRKDVIVGSNVGSFNTVRIEATAGRTYVQKVGIEFTNGVVQMIPVNRTFFNDQSMTFDLDGSNRQISRIFVYRADGEEAHHLNLAHRGEFAVTAL